MVGACHYGHMKPISLAFLVATLLVIAASAALLIAFWNVDYNIVIHFDVFEGIDVLDTPNQAFAALSVAAFFDALFIALARFLAYREPFLAWALALTNVGLMALTLIASIVIIINN